MRRLFYLYIHPETDLKDVVLCKNCAKPVIYGTMINNTGHLVCPDCYTLVAKNIEDTRNNNYDAYRKSTHLYVTSDHEYYSKVAHELNKNHTLCIKQIKQLIAMGYINENT